MKLSALRVNPVEDVVETELDMAAAVVNAAKKTLISQAMLFLFLPYVTLMYQGSLTVVYETSVFIKL